MSRRMWGVVPQGGPWRRPTSAGERRSRTKLPWAVVYSPGRTARMPVRRRMLLGSSARRRSAPLVASSRVVGRTALKN